MSFVPICPGESLSNANGIHKVDLIGESNAKNPWEFLAEEGETREESSFDGTSFVFSYLGEIKSQIKMSDKGVTAMLDPIRVIDNILSIDENRMPINSWSEVFLSGIRYLVHIPEKGVFELFEVKE